MAFDLAEPALLAFTGLVAGSFLGVLVERLPVGGSIVLARSQCRHCSATLSPRDLIPLASWLATRGRCRHCGVPIGWFYPAIEIAAAVLTLWASAVVGTGPALWFTCFFGWCLLALAIIDWRHYLLPNQLTMPLLLAGLTAIYWLNPEALADHAAGVLVGFLSFLLVGWTYQKLRNREGLGFGDAKLLAALGAWVSWSGLPTVILSAALLGLVVTVVQAMQTRQFAAAQRIPFGTYLAITGWFVWLYGPLAVR